MRSLFFLIFIYVCLTQTAFANQFCFAMAETYYEQVYCQLKAKAQTKNLPPFHEFKNNNEAVQALLLKRPAELNGIKLPAPTKKTVVENKKELRVAQPATTVEIKEKPEIVEKIEPAISSVSNVSATDKPVAYKIEQKEKSVLGTTSESQTCQLVEKQIDCSGSIYRLLGNKANKHLAEDALSDKNRINFPEKTDEYGVPHLTQLYRHYIDKMCEIGLGGVTMTYGKFAYLYEDLKTKGIDFNSRFETMYSFLKKDKTAMSVSESASMPSGLTLADCDPLTQTRFVCAHAGRNYIFEL
jgi:hypothetical protein